MADNITTPEDQPQGGHGPVDPLTQSLLDAIGGVPSKASEPGDKGGDKKVGDWTDA